jgi:hypothetical protein
VRQDFNSFLGSGKETPDAKCSHPTPDAAARIKRNRPVRRFRCAKAVSVSGVSTHASQQGLGAPDTSHVLQADAIISCAMALRP